MKTVNKNLPNNLTKLRIVLSIIIIVIMLFPFDMVNINFPKYLIDGNIILDVKLLVVAVLFVIASITDYFDGKIARKYNLVTTFGKFLDPLADKLLVNTALILLVGMLKLPSWVAVIIIAREFIITGVRLLAVEDGKVIAANVWGKVKTVTQMIAIILMLIDTYSFAYFISNKLSGFELGLNILSTVMMSIATIATIFSLIVYLKDSKDVILKTK